MSSRNIIPQHHPATSSRNITLQYYLKFEPEVSMIQDLPTQFNGIQEAPIVTKLVFPHAGVAVEGQFRLNEFALLPAEQLEFLRLYIKVRGNLKEVERVLGISYPTVRARFEQMLRALGYETPPSSDDARDTILSALERGEITSEEALERLKRA
jgi:hypothetical protein